MIEEEMKQKGQATGDVVNDIFFHLLQQMTLHDGDPLRDKDLWELGLPFLIRYQ